MAKRKNPIVRPFDYSRIKKCSECEHSSIKGICKNNTLYRYLRNGCLREPNQPAERR